MITPSCHSDTNPNQGKQPFFRKSDWLFWSAASVVALFYFSHLLQPAGAPPWLSWLVVMAESVFAMINTIWWGILIGFFAVGLLTKLPRELIMAVLGKGGSFKGIIRATLGGVFLDLCSHGILMVGAKLYERGASAGQLIAFLLASPWNSFSLTIILIAFIGLPWTLVFIFLSMAIAILTGVIFDALVKRQVLPPNPHQVTVDDKFNFRNEIAQLWQQTNFSYGWWTSLIADGFSESKMVMKWLFIGVLLAALLRTVISPDQFANYLGPTLMGLALSVTFATILEVCSEGTTPIAADIFNRAGAPGNGFAFLMAGVATDYTEIMVIRGTTLSWKIALFVPLISTPQVLVVAWVLNQFA